MGFRELVRTAEQAAVAALMKSHLREFIPFGQAKLHLEHHRPADFKKVQSDVFDTAMLEPAVLAQLVAKGAVVESGAIWMPDPASYLMVDEPEEVLNQITNAGRDFLHSQGYNTTGLGTNGLNYIALTNTAVTPAAGDTTLSGEITTNGLARAQGAYSHTAGTNTTTIANTFTCATAPQSAQASALFTAAAAGTMNHELTFTQRSLQIGDTLAVTYTITLG